jgi:hypothetical protein
MHSPILAPIVALVAWSLVMQVWLYATRIPAMQAAQTPLNPNLAPGELTAALPPHVRWKADNYNHLMEQPTIFYAIALALALMDFGGGLNLLLAWTYVALRIVHSLVQATVNKIIVRFSVFMLASLCLLALTIQAVIFLLSHGT